MYDAVVIGGGPGGYVSAIRLSQLGKKVALIEKENLGGTCTNKGCIPTKALLTAAHLYSDIVSKSKKFGLKVENVTYEIDGIMRHMNKSVTMSKKGIEYLMKKNNIDVFKGVGEIIDKNHVKVNDRILETSYLILAQGSVPSKFSPFNEIDGIWTSDDVFKMDKLPDSIVIIGGGVIGVEFATFFSALKKEVTIVELADHILPFEDNDVANEIKKSLQKKGVKVYEKSKVKEVAKNKDMYSVIIESDKEFEVSSERVLLAVGRRPNITEDIRKLGVEIEKGIVTDDTMKTSIDNVYAIGDIRAKIMLAHVAMFEGIVAAHNIAGENMKMDYSAIPSIIFSSPEVASTGLKEKDLESENIIVGKFPVSANGRARTMEERDGFAKVIIDKKTKKVLGFSIVSASATDMIMEGVLAIKHGLTLEEVVNSIHPHPTLTETTLGAFEAAEGMAIHI